MNTKTRARYIIWSSYKDHLLINQQQCIIAFLDLFEGNNEIIEKITKLDSVKLREFLLMFADMIDKKGLEKSIKLIEELL